jgi:hypothetical protein
MEGPNIEELNPSHIDVGDDQPDGGDGHQKIDLSGRDMRIPATNRAQFIGLLILTFSCCPFDCLDHHAQIVVFIIMTR